MKKIIISSNTSWNIINFRLNLIEKLIANKFQVILIVPLDGDAYRLKELNVKIYNLKIKSRKISIIEGLKLIYQYYKIFKIEKPNFFLGYTIKPNIFGSIASSLFRNIKICNNITGLGTFYFANFFFKILIINLYKFSLLKSSIIFFQNEDDKNFFLKNKIINKKKDFIVIGDSGVDTNIFAYSKLANHDSALKFSFISRIIVDKGINELIEAINIVKLKYPKTIFSIIGEFNSFNETSLKVGKFKESLKKKLFDYNVFHNNIYNFIRDSDCIILPSYREGSSKILLEAASVGRPLISTDVPGCNNIVYDNINGFLCNPKDSNSLANSIIKMINLPFSKRLDMGINGRKIIVKNFEINSVNRKIINHIENL